MRLQICLLALALTVVWPSSSDAEWTLAAYAGAMHTIPGELRIEQPSRGTALSFPGVPFRSESWQPPIYYGYRIGRSFPRTRFIFSVAVAF